MGNSPCLRGTTASAGRQHHRPPSRSRGYQRASAQPPLSHCSSTPGVPEEPPRPRHFVSAQAGGAATGLGLNAPYEHNLPQEEGADRLMPPLKVPLSPARPPCSPRQPTADEAKRRRLRHDRHPPQPLPALCFIPPAARRLAALPVCQAGNFPGAEPAQVLVAERRDPDRDPDPDPNPDRDPDPSPAVGARQVSSERCGALPPSRTGALPGAPGSYWAPRSRRPSKGARAGGNCRDRGYALPVSGRFSGSRAARVVGVRVRRGPGPRRPPGICPGAARCRGLSR